MALASGTRLGPYEILAPIGAGGMGEVYRARDTRLDRIVAVKVLPEQVAGREQLRERLAREAKAVSSLNHPHICALYDVGHQDGVDYLVMEHLEGETLGARLEKGALPLDELLRFAAQLADALAVAHRGGLVHRDLKPGNIMLTPAGAKLLDFGLAKSFEGTLAASSLTAAPTATSPLTAQGMILGTFHYMAPEQLEGGQADARSDIFSFGLILYEMAAGRRAFEGKTQAGLIASIMKETPRCLSELAPMTPPALERLVRTCLEKDPDARRQTMNDVLLDLRWIAEAGSQAGVPAPASRRRRAREQGLWLLTVAAVAAAATLAVLWQRAESRPPRVIASSIVPPAEAPLRPGLGLALSPDGAHLAFVGAGEGGTEALWVRPLDRAEARLLPGTDGAEYPFWSADGRHLAFFADGKLKRIDSRGGPTQVLAATADARGGAWNAEGTIVYAPDFRGGLWRIPATGGSPVEITQTDRSRGESSHRWPWFLPDGRHVLFLAQTHEGGSPDDKSRVEVLDLETGEHRELFAANSSIQYSPTGHVLFWSQGAVYAQPFDAARRRLTGDIFPVADKVLYTVNELAAFAVAGEETLVFQGGEGVTGQSALAWFDRAGKPGEEITGTSVIFSPRLSGDGRRLAYERQGDIWVHDLERGAATRLTFDAGDEFDPIWSPDDRWIAYSTRPAQDAVLYRKLASGLGVDEEIHRVAGQSASAIDWSRDGSALLLSVQGPETDLDLSILRVEDGSVQTLVQTPFFESLGRFSPDGEWFAYSSNESGSMEVYVVRLTGPGGRWQVSTDGGSMPAWRRDGKEIYYVAPGARLMAVPVALGETFKAGMPEVLFEAAFRPGGSYPYEPAADGQRFVVNAVPGATTSLPLSLIQNWTAAVEK
jgi:Tol biopolymer transport system component